MCNFPQYRGDKEQFDRNTAFTSSYFPCVESHESERRSTTKPPLSLSLFRYEKLNYFAQPTFFHCNRRR